MANAPRPTPTQTASGPPVTTSSPGCRSGRSATPTWPPCSPTSTSQDHQDPGDTLRSGTPAPVLAMRVRASVGRPGASAHAEYRRRRAAERGRLDPQPALAGRRGAGRRRDRRAAGHPGRTPPGGPGWRSSCRGRAGLAAAVPAQRRHPGLAARGRRGAAHRPPPRPPGAPRLGGPARPGHPRHPGQHRSPGHRPRRGAGHRHQAVPGAAAAGPRRDAVARPPPARLGPAQGAVGRPTRPTRSSASPTSRSPPSSPCMAPTSPGACCRPTASPSSPPGGCPTCCRRCRRSLGPSGWPGWPTGPGCGSAPPPDRLHRSALEAPLLARLHRAVAWCA